MHIVTGAAPSKNVQTPGAAILAASSRRQDAGAPIDAWRAAHRRLYEHLCATTKEGDQPTLEDRQPLYQAVAHGCQAGLQKEVFWKPYMDVIRRRQEAYSVRKLGCFGTELGAIASFFDQPWTRPSPGLNEPWQVSWLVNAAAFCLRALGRLTEAVEPMRISGEMDVEVEAWKGAAASYSNLSELELTLGEVAEAEGDAEQSVTYADRSGDKRELMEDITTHADALHQAGRRAEAQTRFREAEQMHAKDQPDYPLLYSLRGFMYCHLLLAAPERAAWQICLGSAGYQPAPVGNLPTGTGASAPSPSGRRSTPSASPVASGRLPDATGRLPVLPLIDSCRAVSQRAAQTLKWVTDAKLGLLTIALDHLTLGRASLYAAILERTGAPVSDPASASSPQRAGSEIGAQDALQTARRELDAAGARLRGAGTTHHIPHDLLTRAWCSFAEAMAHKLQGQEKQVVERGPMRLFMADIHLYRASLFGRRERVISDQLSVASDDKYPWESPQADLAAARKLIEAFNYWRRKEELEVAEKAAKSWAPQAGAPAQDGSSALQ